MAWQALAAEGAKTYAAKEQQDSGGAKGASGGGGTASGVGSGGASGGLFGIRGAPIGGGGTIDQGATTFSPHQPINIAPIGVNIGEILKGPNSGASTNGGQPLDASLGYPSMMRASNGAAVLPAARKGGGSGDMQLLGYGGLGLLGLFAAWLVIR